MTRLVAISNRVGPVEDRIPQGGLAVALVDALKKQSGIWYGWSGRITSQSDGRLSLKSVNNVTLATLDLSEADCDEYYNGFANCTLWPLFHYRIDVATFDRHYYQGYQRVNAYFAQSLMPLLQSEDVIWIHDYHFIPLGRELRKLGCRLPIGFFLHIPFPPRGVLTAMPNHERLIKSLFDYDLMGFQTDTDREAFLDYIEHEAGGTVTGNTVRAFDRTLQVHTSPIGIDIDDMQAMSTSDAARVEAEGLRDVLEGRAHILGVDRLDYTKGLVDRFLAFERFLEDHPEQSGRVRFTQIAPPSRTNVEEYVDIRHELEQITGRVNSHYAQLDWTPLKYLNMAFPRDILAGIYRMSRVGLVTPLRDGMNLVAKEFIAAQDPEDPGVLILSRFAGAAAQMRDALIVNPYDIQDVADAINTALNMSREERKERYDSLMPSLREQNVHRWCEDFLHLLENASKHRIRDAA